MGLSLRQAAPIAHLSAGRKEGEKVALAETKAVVSSDDDEDDDGGGRGECREGRGGCERPTDGLARTKFLEMFLNLGPRAFPLSFIK